MIPDSGPAWRTRRCGPADAHGLAILLVAVILAAGTALPQLGRGGPALPPPPAPQTIERSAPEAGTSVAVRTAGHEAGEPRLPTPLNINTANAEALQALPGIGPALAERIVADREAHGPFRAPEDLLRVHGIGPRRWERIRPVVRLTEKP
jgi:competence protein ComEA